MKKKQSRNFIRASVTRWIPDTTQRSRINTHSKYLRKNSNSNKPRHLIWAVVAWILSATLITQCPPWADFTSEDLRFIIIDRASHFACNIASVRCSAICSGINWGWNSSVNPLVSDQTLQTWQTLLPPEPIRDELSWCAHSVRITPGCRAYFVQGQYDSARPRLWTSRNKIPGTKWRGYEVVLRAIMGAARTCRYPFGAQVYSTRSMKLRSFGHQ